MLVVCIQEHCLLQPFSLCISNQAELGTELGVFKLPLADETRSSFQLFRTLENEKECRKLPDQLISDSCSKYTENTVLTRAVGCLPFFFFFLN